MSSALRPRALAPLFASLLGLLALGSWAIATDSHAQEAASRALAESAESSGGPVRSAEGAIETFAHEAVAADHPLASEAGAAILAAGGTAADAAAATMLTLGVANPASSGIGGGGFALYYRASDQSLTFVDFRERAPSSATPEMYEGEELARGWAERFPEGRLRTPSQIGGLAVGVPGEAAGIAALVERFGRKSLAEIAAPAIRLAREGVEPSAATQRMGEAFGAQLRADPELRRWFAEGDPFAAGGRLVQPRLAQTLERFARQGKRGFYTGPTARAIVAAVRRAGGSMSMEDLADYEVVIREPLSATHFGLRWVTAPPPSAGGFTMLQSLAVLEALPTRWRPIEASRNGEDPRTAAFFHALAESWKGPFADRQRYFGDPDHVTLPLDRLRDPARIQARATIFHPTLARPAERYALPLQADEPEIVQPDNAGTSHLCVVDREGNVASITTTVNLPFGARVGANGVVLNDEMDDFARAVGEANAFGLVGGAPNLPGPGKRMVSTMSPTIVFGADGRPALCAGASGGSRIVTATQQVAMNLLLFGMSAEAAMGPRVHHQGAPDALRIEEVAPIADELQEELRTRGHTIEPIHNVANVQAIHITAEGLVAISDPRKGGRPAGR